MKKGTWKLLAVMVFAVALITMMTACGGQADEISVGAAESVSGSEVPEFALDEAESTDLLQQIADREIEKQYADVLPEEAFANAVVFGTETEGDQGTMYVRLNTSDYVAVKDKAYMISGAEGEAIISYMIDGDSVKLADVEWSADGENHDAWIEENFPEEAFEAYKAYEGYDENGYSQLAKALIPQVEEKMGVPVETELLLEIDDEKGTYEIMKTIESGSPEEGTYEFDTETVEKGKLSDLKQ